MSDSFRRRLAPAAAALALIGACGQGPQPATHQTSTGRINLQDKRLLEALAPASTPSQRSGLAAAIMIDVSGSMGKSPRRGSDPKIASARRSALDLVDQFARYAKDHPSEPVLLGIYEFSARRGQPSAREILPMGPPPARARAAEAIAGMKASGDTPIGEAMIAGKRALDATGLSRRHLLVITDGENTEGFEPGEVATALAQRPETERPSVYFVAFDIEASRFDEVKEQGALVLEAADSHGLNQTLDMLLRGEILVER